MSRFSQYCRLNVHVCESDVHVIKKATRQMLSAGGRERTCRDDRHAWLRDILKHHHDEQELVRRWRF